ncbi:hypothetical protein DPEC_G00295570 [Dallia pectoralis]|uniref:Uncharacterized protein n=1 Tax=Dallia pectoralis TaxID=75939 RepID=A0ACC2FIJ1_DALPE|nr:hypothetical protein DPEC_G00295570 [Dallia pectoralis]
MLKMTAWLPDKPTETRHCAPTIMYQPWELSSWKSQMRRHGALEVKVVTSGWHLALAAAPWQQRALEAVPVLGGVR